MFIFLPPLFFSEHCGAMSSPAFSSGWSPALLVGQHKHNALVAAALWQMCHSQGRCAMGVSTLHSMLSPAYQFWELLLSLL